MTTVASFLSGLLNPYLFLKSSSFPVNALTISGTKKKEKALSYARAYINYLTLSSQYTWNVKTSNYFPIRL